VKCYKGGNTAGGSEAGDQVIPGEAEIVAQRRINKILDTQLIAPLEYSDTPLREILNILQDDYDFPIVVDGRALEESGINPEQEISINLRNITLRGTLELMLRQVEGLNYTIEGQVLMITSKEAAAEHRETRTYRVDDLLGPGQRFNGADTEEVYEPLIRVITHTVERDSWRKNGTGEGEIQPLEPGMLVIVQTQRVHRKIERLLADIRHTRRSIDTSREGLTRSVQPMTRGFKIDVELGENPQEVLEQIAESVRQSVDWESSQSERNESAIWLRALPGRLLVRNFPSVVCQVKKVLLDMKLAKRDSHGQVGGGGGGFGGGGFGFGGGGGGQF